MSSPSSFPRDLPPRACSASVPLVLLALASCSGSGEGTQSGDCRDGADNDGDGMFDCDDDGCGGSPDCEDADTGTPSSRDVSGDCLAYLECMAVVDPDNAALYQATYGEGGECWTTTAAAALACTQACQAGLQAAHIADPGVEACWTGDTPDMLLVFGATETWTWTESRECEPLDRTTTRFSATTSGPEFAMEFDTLLWGDWEWESDHECTEVGWTFACLPFDNYGMETWTFSGTFADRFESGALELVVTSDDGDLTCSWTGEPR